MRGGSNYYLGYRVTILFCGWLTKFVQPPCDIKWQFYYDNDNGVIHKNYNLYYILGQKFPMRQEQLMILGKGVASI